jgi:hypothetical protein
MTMTHPRLSPSTTAAVLLVLLAISVTPAHAQFRPRMTVEPTIGEHYHIEGGVELWFPTADLVVSSGGSGALTGLTGTSIDAKNDLGMKDKNLPQFNFVLRPARKHKLRLQYVPIKYEQTATIPRRIDFNGQKFDVGVPVNSSLDWKALRIGYEYDFIVRQQGFVGFIVEDKQTDIRVDLATPLANPPAQFSRTQAPIPSLGGIGRFYPVPRVSITGEVTGFKLPDTVDDRYRAHYVDVDIYGTVNATNNVGVQVGFRSLDMGYLIKEDSGSFTLKGIYIGVVARY